MAWEGELIEFIIFALIFTVYKALSCPVLYFIIVITKAFGEAYCLLLVEKLGKAQSKAVLCSSAQLERRHARGGL